MSEVTESVKLVNFFWRDHRIVFLDDTFITILEESRVIYHDRIGRVDYRILPPLHHEEEERVVVSIKYTASPHITEGDIDRLVTHIECDIRCLEYTEEEVVINPDHHEEVSDDESTTPEDYDADSDDESSEEWSDEGEYESSW